MIVSSSSTPATASGSVRTYGNTATLRNNRRCDTRKTWHHLETRRIAMPANHPNSDDHQYLMSKSESGNVHDRIEANTELPTQGDAAVAGIDAIDYINQQLQDILKGPPSTEDYLAVGIFVWVYSLIDEAFFSDILAIVSFCFSFSFSLCLCL